MAVTLVTGAAGLREQLQQRHRDPTGRAQRLPGRGHRERLVEGREDLHGAVRGVREQVIPSAIRTSSPARTAAPSCLDPSPSSRQPTGLRRRERGRPEVGADLVERRAHRRRQPAVAAAQDPPALLHQIVRGRRTREHEWQQPGLREPEGAGRSAGGSPGSSGSPRRARSDRGREPGGERVEMLGVDAASPPSPGRPAAPRRDPARPGRRPAGTCVAAARWPGRGRRSSRASCPARVRAAPRRRSSGGRTSSTVTPPRTAWAPGSRSSARSPGRSGSGTRRVRRSVRVPAAVTVSGASSRESGRTRAATAADPTCSITWAGSLSSARRAPVPRGGWRRTSTTLVVSHRPRREQRIAAGERLERHTAQVHRDPRHRRRALDRLAQRLQPAHARPSARRPIPRAPARRRPTRGRLRAFR